ncbi:MAG: hypothetical protein JJU45_09270 [Acidimicrobiia bacterium]|nr:hypothetical protein [Acidimicrobiia bacterium]
MSSPDATPPKPSRPPPLRERAGGLTVVVVVLAVVPLLVGALVALGRPWWPASDWALIDLRTRDVGTTDTPLVGVFSRVGWNHPGPLLFWLFAPIQRLAGSPAGLMAAAALWNAVSLTTALWLARRTGGRGFLLLVGSAMSVMVVVLGGVLVDPWNPWIAVLPFAVFVLATWTTSTGDLVGIPLAVISGSFVVQAHIGYAALVVPLAVWTAAALAWTYRRRTAPVEPTSRWQRPTMVLTVSGLVGLLLWIGPIVEQVTTSPGNLRRIASHFGTAGESTIGPAEALGIVARQFALLPPWLGGDEPIDIFTAGLVPASLWWALPTVALFVVGVLVALRRRDGVVVRLQGALAVTIVAGVVATARIEGDAFFYLVRWWWVVSLLVWVCTAWALGRAIPSDRGAHLARLGAPVALTTMLLMGMATITELFSPVETTTHNLAVEAIADDLAAALDRDGRYLIAPIGVSWFETYFGVVNELDRRGFDVVADERFTSHFGAHRIDDGQPVDATILVATGDVVAELRNDDELRTVAGYDPLSPDERTELDELRARARRDLVAAGRDDLLGSVDDGGLRYFAIDEPAIDGTAAERIGDLLEAGTWVEVFVAPPRWDGAG